MPLIISTPTASSPHSLNPSPRSLFIPLPASQTLPHLIPAMVAKEDDRTATLITRDFLGGGGLRPSNSGGLEPGRKKAYLDLNLMPNSDLKLGLGLGLEKEAMPMRFGYESVCTLDKVRLALERAGRETRGGGGGGGGRKRREEGGGASTSSTTTTSSVRRKRSEDESYEEEEESTTTMDSSAAAAPAAAAAMLVAGCPRCLLYVLICKGNPRCPRCGSHVPVAVLEGKKRARIDLNSSV